MLVTTVSPDGSASYYTWDEDSWPDQPVATTFRGDEFLLWYCNNEIPQDATVETVVKLGTVFELSDLGPVEIATRVADDDHPTVHYADFTSHGRFAVAHAPKPDLESVTSSASIWQIGAPEETDSIYNVVGLEGAVAHDNQTQPVLHWPRAKLVPSGGDDVAWRELVKTATGETYVSTAVDGYYCELVWHGMVTMREPGA